MDTYDPFEHYVAMDVIDLNTFNRDLMCLENGKFLIRDCMWSGVNNDMLDDFSNYDKFNNFDYSLRIKGLSDFVDDTDGLEWNQCSLPNTISSPLSSDNSNSSTDVTLPSATPTSFTHQLKTSSNSSTTTSQQFAAATASLLKNSSHSSSSSSSSCSSNSSNSSSSSSSSSCNISNSSNSCSSSTSRRSNSNHNTSNTISSNKPSTNKSLYPQRRKEHNKSEKKRRDHLRNAFNSLKDQIPKLKTSEKKVARVTILKEATSYVNLLNDKHQYLEKTKRAELVKKDDLLKRLKQLQLATGQECAF